MAELIRFFPRQTLVFLNASSEYYSEIFDTTENPTVVVEGRIFYQSAVQNIVVDVEETSDPTLNNWTSNTASVGFSSGAKKLVPVAVLRFIRVKLSIAGAASVTLSVEGNAS
ncbi:MAG: hypothetical protein O7H41_09780 [Planctomycetota bacterium]|nr:hypothetical protein [Planctomycetota bacterium]